MKTANLRTVALSDILSLPVHPVADLFPMLPNEVRKEDGKNETLTLPELADSILENGLQEPIVLSCGKILDGRNRRAGCLLVVEALDSTPEEYEVQVEDFIGSDEEANEYVLALNVDRRDLTPGQRAFIAVGYWDIEAAKAKARQLAGLKQNQDRAQESFPETQGQARDFLAQRFRVNAHYITDARRISQEIDEGRNQADLAAQEAESQRNIAKQKTAELEAANAAHDAQKAAEASAAANRAKHAAIEAAEKASEKATQASTAANRADKVRAGSASMNSLAKPPKPEVSDTDPTVKFRNKINSAMASFKLAVTELAAVSGQGQDDYNFVGRKITDMIQHFESEFGIQSADEKL